MNSFRKYTDLHAKLIFILSITVGGLLTGVPAFATDNCIQDVWKSPPHSNTQNLTCTANDVRVAFADNIRDVNGTALTQCTSGTTFSFIADFHTLLTAQTRYDIGLYFATDGDPNHNGALTGQCDGNIITSQAIDPAPPMSVMLGSPNFVQYDAAPDKCGDIDSGHNPQVVTVRVDNVSCVDTDGDGKLNLPNCTSWRTSGQNELCQSSFDAFPGAPSKCNCDPNFNIPIFVETGTIDVTKTVTDPANATLPEPGGQFTYQITVDNTATVTSITLDKICDDKFGQIVKTAAADACPAGSIGTIDSTDCVVPTTLAAGASYSCSFKASAFGDPQDITDTITVFGHDQNDKPVQDTATAQVHIADAPPVAEVIKSFDSLLCSIVRYGVQVNNKATAESLTLSTLNDSVFGDITTVQDNIVATTCAVPQTIAQSGTYNCTFDAKFCGASHTDTITGMMNDNENNSITQVSNTVIVNVSGQQQ